MRDVQCMYQDIGTYDMLYSEYKEMCHKAWSEKFNYLCIDRTKKKKEGIYRIFSESKHTYIDCICETCFNFRINLYVLDIRYQKNLENAQPIKVEYMFSENGPNGTYGYALVLTNRLTSIGSEG